MAKTKVSVRLVGFPLDYVDGLKKLFDDNFSVALSECVSICMEATKKNRGGSVLNETWYESPKRHRKVDSNLEKLRKEKTFAVSTFLDDEQLKFVERHMNKVAYPQFRGSRVNVISACVYFAVREMVFGTCSIKLVKEEEQLND